METVLLIVMALAVSALFSKTLIEKRLADVRGGQHLEAWHLFFRIIWGIVAWWMLTALTAGALQGMFPKEPIYIFSGSWITIIPALFWAAIVCWVVIGKTAAAEGDSKLATYEDRIDAVIFGAGKVLKWVIIGAVAVGGLGVVLFVGWLVGERLETALSGMAPSTAIIFGAIIIAAAIMLSRRPRHD